MALKKLLPATVSLKRIGRSLGSSRTIRKFAMKHGIVYFGTVHPDDEARLVRGITQSRAQRDLHYCVGTIYGRDVMFVQRSDKMLGSKTPTPELYTWNILVVDMSDVTQLPHTYVEGRGRHGSGFRDTVSMKYRTLSEVPVHVLSTYDPLFSKRYSTRTLSDKNLEFPAYLTPERAAIVAHHFNLFDYEWFEDTLYVYYLAKQPTLDKLDLQLKAGIWLAGELEKKQIITQTPHATETPIASSFGY